MPILDQHQDLSPLDRQFITQHGGISLELHPPQMLVISFTEIMANREDVDEFLPVLEAWTDERAQIVVLHDLRGAKDMALENRMYMASRFKQSAFNLKVLRLAFLTRNTYHRVMLAGAFVIAPPPAPYLITTKEEEAVDYLLRGKD